MNYEDAYYFKILLQSGRSDGYDKWLHGYLETEDPLSDIVLELSFYSSDLNKTISCLDNYCAKENVNTDVVCDKLRLFLKEAYHANRLTKKEVCSYMYRFAYLHHGYENFTTPPWNNMFRLEDYYSLAEEGYLSWDRFDFAFHSYLDDGIAINPRLPRNRKKRNKSSWFHNIKNLFRRNQ